MRQMPTEVTPAATSVRASARTSASSSGVITLPSWASRSLSS
jgi:hypothetical protein